MGPTIVSIDRLAVRRGSRRPTDPRSSAFWSRGPVVYPFQPEPGSGNTCPLLSPVITWEASAKVTISVP